MEISLPPELDEAVRKKVAAGHYSDASEVIQEALRQFLAREQKNERLIHEAAIGFAQLEAGEVRRVTTKQEFEDLHSLPGPR